MKEGHIAAEVLVCVVGDRDRGLGRAIGRGLRPTGAVWGLGINAEGVNESLGVFDLGGLNYPAAWQDFHDLAQDRGYDWTQEYTSDESSYGLGFDAKWFLEAGLSGDYTSTSRTATNYTYWNGADYVTRPACVA